MKTKSIFWIIIFVISLSNPIFISSSGVQQNQYQIPTSQNPFVRNEVIGDSGVSGCQFTVTNKDTLFVWVADYSSINPSTINDTLGNTWTGIPSASAGTFLRVTTTVDNLYTETQEEYLYFAYNINGNGTDLIRLQTAPSSTSIMYCADIGAENSTGWETLPTQPIQVRLNQYAIGNAYFSINSYGKIPMPANFTGYANGLDYSLMWGLDTTQQPSLQINSGAGWTSGCIVGVLGSCRWISLNAGASSWNGNIENSIGAMNNGAPLWTISQTNCAGNDCASIDIDAVISFPNTQTCINCPSGITIVPNNPNNYDLNTYVSKSMIPIFFIVLPTLLFGFIGLYFGAGIYGYVFGEIIGASIGLYTNLLNIWVFLVSLYGAIALFYVSHGESSTIEDTTYEDEEL